MLNGIPRILIVRLSAIGDVVRVLPALHCLRDVYPEAQIDWVVESKSAEVLEGHPALDRVLVFERAPQWTVSARNFLELCKIIRKSRYDVVIDFHGILKSGLITGVSGAPKRYGFARPRSREGSYIFTNKKTKLGSEVVNRIHENLALCFDFHPGYKSLDVTMAIPDDAIEAVEDFFEESFHGAKVVVAMHVPVDRPEKQWPLDHFAELSDLLLADGRFDVLLTWGPGQFKYIQEMLGYARREPVVAPATDSLKQYMAMVQQADIYFGGDTGPMHIASALDTPVVAVFGGTNPAQHATLRIPYTVLTPESNTKKSGNASGKPTDMSRISPESAYDAIVDIASFTSR